MPRYKLTIEYCGTDFCGWQRQSNGRAVQQAVEEALRAVEPEMPAIAAAGRTDAGVHALGQVAHCDLSREWEPARLRRSINHFLGREGVAVVEVTPVSDEFHARFSALERHYLYRIVQRSATLVLDANRAWQVVKPLDLEAMREGAGHLIGHHDFTTFRSVHCQSKSPVKTLDMLAIEQEGDEFRFAVRARSFLHNQVRSLVGTLVHVGRGQWHPQQVGEALRAADRAACGTVAPPDGLYLERVVYPDDSA